MKKINIILNVLLVIIVAICITACRKTKQVLNSENYIIEFNTDNKYEFRYESKYFRNAREEAIIVSDNFRLGVENPIKIKGISNFNKLKKESKNNDDFKEISYSDYKGFLFYTDSYVRYEIYFCIDNNYIVRFNLYTSPNNQKTLKKALASDELKDVLDNMDVTIKN